MGKCLQRGNQHGLHAAVKEKVTCRVTCNMIYHVRGVGFAGMVGVCVANKQQRWWFRVKLGQSLLVYFTVCLDCFPPRFISLNIWSSKFLYHLKPFKKTFFYCLS